MLPRVAVIYLSFKNSQYLDTAFASLAVVTYPRDRFEVIVVDNKVPNDPSEENVRIKILPRSGQDFPTVSLIVSSTNSGFAGGMNIGMRAALERGFDYVFLLNQDARVAPDFLDEVVRAAESDPYIGAVQSLLVLYPDTSLVDSWGNEWHYLGLGYGGGYRRPVSEVNLDALKDVSYASGAGVLYRAATLRDVGLFDEEMFLYHEDTDLSLRMRYREWRVVLAPRSKVFHEYEFKRSIVKYYWMLRNHLFLFFTIPTWRTLLLILPMQLVFLVALIGVGLTGGYWREVFRAYGYFLKPRTWRYLAERRRELAAKRQVSDRIIYEKCISDVRFQEVSSWVLEKIGNPMMRGYWKLVWPLIK